MVPIRSLIIEVAGNSVVLSFNVINAIPPVTINNVMWLVHREGNFNDITNGTMINNTILTFESNSTTQVYSLTISNVQPSYSSRFILSVSNPAGKDSNFINLIIEGIQW